MKAGNGCLFPWEKKRSAAESHLEEVIFIKEVVKPSQERKKERKTREEGRTVSKREETSNSNQTKRAKANKDPQGNVLLPDHGVGLGHPLLHIRGSPLLRRRRGNGSSP